MIWLLLAIGCTSALALVLKLGETRELDRFAVVAVNYLTALIGAGVMVWQAGAEVALPPPGSGDAIATALSTGARVDPSAGPSWALGWGVITGGLFFLGLWTYQRAIRAGGVGLAAAMSRLGVLVPMLASMGLWGVALSAAEWGGVALALTAIAVANAPARGVRLRDALRPALLTVFICVGLSEFSSKVFQQHGHLVDKPLFVAATFAVAGLIALLVVAARRPRWGWPEVAVGVGVGVPNLLGMVALIEALDALPAAVVYPAIGAGAVLVVQLAGVLLFGEKPGARGWTVVGLTAAALVLINI